MKYLSFIMSLGCAVIFYLWRNEKEKRKQKEKLVELLKEENVKLSNK